MPTETRDESQTYSIRTRARTNVALINTRIIALERYPRHTRLSRLARVTHARGKYPQAIMALNQMSRGGWCNPRAAWQRTITKIQRRGVECVLSRPKNVHV